MNLDSEYNEKVFEEMKENTMVFSVNFLQLLNSRVLKEMLDCKNAYVAVEQLGKYKKIDFAVKKGDQIQNDDTVPNKKTKVFFSLSSYRYSDTDKTFTKEIKEIPFDFMGNAKKTSDVIKQITNDNEYVYKFKLENEKGEFDMKKLYILINLYLSVLLNSSDSDNIKVSKSLGIVETNMNADRIYKKNPLKLQNLENENYNEIGTTKDNWIISRFLNDFAFGNIVNQEIYEKVPNFFNALNELDKNGNDKCLYVKNNNEEQQFFMEKFPIHKIEFDSKVNTQYFDLVKGDEPSNYKVIEKEIDFNQSYLKNNLYQGAFQMFFDDKNKTIYKFTRKPKNEKKNEEMKYQNLKMALYIYMQQIVGQFYDQVRKVLEYKSLHGQTQGKSKNGIMSGDIILYKNVSNLT